MWHKQSFTQFWSQSDAYSRRSSLKLTYIHHPLVVCTHQICCAVAVPIALSQDRLLHGHNRLVNWTPCSRMRESKLKIKHGLTNPSMASTSNERQAIITQNTTGLNHVMMNASAQCYRPILKAVRSYLWMTQKHKGGKRTYRFHEDWGWVRHFGLHGYVQTSHPLNNWRK